MPHLFIAGAPRCGTTTLFDALAPHPGVAPCRVKEPGFLYPANFPTQGFQLVRFEEGLERYLALFGGRPGLRMEATANYLYAPGVAQRIQALFSDARVVVVLRNPIDRLVSEFRFAQLMRVLPHSMSFDDYLALQRGQVHEDPWREPHLRALSNGLYSRFVAAYLSALGPDRVHVTWTEALSRDPRHTLQGISSFAGIDPGHFDSYALRSRNTAREITRPAAYALAFRLNVWRTARIVAGRESWATRLGEHVVTRLLRHSTRTAKPLVPDRGQREFLEAFYREDAVRLEALLGVRPPWRLVEAA